MRVWLVILSIVALAMTFFGAWSAWRGITRRANEAVKPSTYEDLMNLRPMIFGPLNRESRWGVALMATGALLNTVISIWTMFI